MKTSYKLAAATAAFVLATSSIPAYADLISTEAADNATIQVAGPRTGANGKNFFNVEGSTNGAFASYGAADFNFGALPGTVVGLGAVTLKLTQSNAAFSTTGPVIISLDNSAVLANIQPVTSPLNFDGVDPGTTTDTGQGDINPVVFLGGPYTYTVVATGTVDTYNLVVNPPLASMIMNRLNAGSTIRILIGSGAANVAATWAGFSNATLAGPTLDLEVTYEPGVPVTNNTWGKIKAAYRD